MKWEPPLLICYDWHADWLLESTTQCIFFFFSFPTKAQFGSLNSAFYFGNFQKRKTAKIQKLWRMMKETRSLERLGLTWLSLERTGGAEAVAKFPITLSFLQDPSYSPYLKVQISEAILAWQSAATSPMKKIIHENYAVEILDIIAGTLSLPDDKSFFRGEYNGCQLIAYNCCQVWLLHCKEWARENSIIMALGILNHSILGPKLQLQECSTPNIQNAASCRTQTMIVLAESLSAASKL